MTATGGQEPTPVPDGGDLGRRLHFGWVALPILIGGSLTTTAVLGHTAWNWNPFWTGALVNFGAAISLVSLFFLLERRFERTVEAQSRSAVLGLHFPFARGRELRDLQRLLTSGVRPIAAATGDMNFRLGVYRATRRLRGGFRRRLELVADLDLAPAPSEVGARVREIALAAVTRRVALLASEPPPDVGSERSPRSIMALPLHSAHLLRATGTLVFASYDQLAEPDAESVFAVLRDLAMVAEAILR